MKVLVQSFSYSRTGYPKDTTGQGGGFVFDCRSFYVFDSSAGYNYDSPPAFIYLVTGRSPVIIEALDRNLKAQRFFNALWTLVEMNIDKCLKANIDIISVSFGCVNGQHRSVYMAEKFARKIKMVFPDMEVDLVHLEQAHWPKME